MRINEAKDVIRKFIQLDVPVLMYGHAGIGKTEIIKQLGKELDMKVKIVVLSKFEQGDLMGMPVVVGDKTVYMRPEWLPSEPNTILFLDEINRAPVYLRQGLLELIQERQVGDFTLPEGCRIVAAANPDTEDYIVSDMDDQALLTRFAIITVENSASDLANYLQSKDFDDELVLAVVSTLDHLGSFSKDVPIPKIQPNPRSFERLAKVYKEFIGMPEHIMLEVFSGIVGYSAAAEFLRRLKTRVLSKEDFFTGNIERIRSAPLVEKTLVMASIIRDKQTERVPTESLDALTDEEWISVLRLIASKPREMAEEFNLKLRRRYKRIAELLSS